MHRAENSVRECLQGSSKLYYLSAVNHCSVIKIKILVYHENF